MLTAVAAFLSIVTGVIVLVFMFWPDIQPERDKTPKVAISDFNVDKEKNIQADELYMSSELETETRPIDWKSSMATVTLRNEGDDSVVIRKVSLRLLDFERLGCAGGGGLGYPEGRYHFKVGDAAKPGKTLVRKMRWELPAHESETLAFTIGPSAPDPDVIHVYRYQLILEPDRGSPIKLPIIAHAAPEEYLSGPAKGVKRDYERINSSSDPCWRGAARFARNIKADDKKSPEFRYLQSRLPALRQ
ncbi:hypothetical protein ACFY65_33675 [Streptomyces cellulosae]